jgi:hypothetical protein
VNLPILEELHPLAAPGLTTPEVGLTNARFHNSPETAKKLGEILYPEAGPRGLPDGVDLLVYLAFQNPGALVPISQDLLINGMTFLVEFLGRERGTRCLQQFLREARSRLSHCGWPSDMQTVRSTLSSCQLVACSNTTSCRARSSLGHYFWQPLRSRPLLTSLWCHLINWRLGALDQLWLCRQPFRLPLKSYLCLISPSYLPIPSMNISSWMEIRLRCSRWTVRMELCFCHTDIIEWQSKELKGYMLGHNIIKNI